jgi:hypothetical protein
VFLLLLITDWTFLPLSADQAGHWSREGYPSPELPEDQAKLAARHVPGNGAYVAVVASFNPSKSLRQFVCLFVCFRG